MANQLILNATRANTPLPVEFYNPVTQQWVDGVQQNGGDSYQVTLTGIPAGTYSGLKCRLKGSNPAITGTFAQTVTVVDAGAAGGGATATRQQTGLLFRSDGSLNGWSATSQWSSAALPALVAFAPSPIPALVAGDSGSRDYGGVREGEIYRETVGGVETWYQFYGAGDGTDSIDGEWSPQLAKSTDKGLTWLKLGRIGPGQRQNGSGDAPYSRDFLYFTRWTTSPIGDVYVLYAMKAYLPSAPSDRGRIPQSPYGSDIWTQPATGNGPQPGAANWTYQLNDVTPTHNNGDYDAFCAYCGSVAKIGNSYYNFYNASQDAATLNIGLAKSSSPLGPFTRSGALFNTADVKELLMENPKYFYHSVLGKHFLFANEGNLFLRSTNTNSYVMSDSPDTWDFKGHAVFQRTNALQGLTALGIPSPMYGADGQAYITPEGYVPFTYDCDPALGGPGTAQPNNVHVARKLRYNCLEPSPLALRFAGNLTASQRFADNFNRAAGPLGGNWQQAEGRAFATNGSKLTMETTPGSDVMVNSSLSFADGTLYGDLFQDSGCGIGFVCRYLDSNRFYLLDINPVSDSDGSKAAVAFFKKTSSGYVQLGSTLATQIQVPASTTWPAKVVIAGSTFKVYSGSTLIATFTDNTYTTAGLTGLRNGGGGTGQRIVDNYSALVASGASNGSAAGASFTDEFTGTGDLAASWVLAEGTKFQQNGSQCDIGSAPGSNLMVNNTVTFTNGTVQAKDFVVEARTGVGVVFRYTSDENFYLIDLSANETGALGYAFYKKTSGGYSQIGQAVSIPAGLYTQGQPVTASVQVLDANYSLFINGQQAAQLTDSSYLAAGYGGLRSGNSGTGQRLVGAFSVVSDTTVLTNPASVPSLSNSVAQTDYVAEFTVEFDEISAEGYVEFWGRVQANGDHYTVRCYAGGSLVGGKVVSGASQALSASAGGVSTTQATSSGQKHIVQVVQKGSSLKAYLDGELQLNAVDSSFASGSGGRLTATGGAASVRLFKVLADTAVTISSVPAGKVVTLRGYGDYPVATTTSSGGTLTLTAPHYPIASITVDGATVAAPAGGIWGGDVFAYNA